MKRIYPVNYQPAQEPDSVKCWLMALKLVVACRAVLVSQQQEIFRCAKIGSQEKIDSIFNAYVRM